MLTDLHCPGCGQTDFKPHTSYPVRDGTARQVLYCARCDLYFAETYDTPLAGLRTPLSRIISVLDALQEGLGINAAVHVFHVAKNSIYLWLDRLADLKETLLLYALCHRFVSQFIEGDEVYTRIKANVPAAASSGWTIVLMERASRFLWELECGDRDRELFAHAMQNLSQVIEQSHDLSLVTDGERRYGQLLFEICREAVRTGRVGRPRLTMPEGVTVRLKNKGTQAHKKGRKRPKYQAPVPEHPHTAQTIANADIHANHLEAFNSALRRRLSAFRRRTNTYAKATDALQRRLDVYWLWHNFIKPHFTTKQVPAVRLGIVEHALSWLDLFKIQRLFPSN